MANLNKVLLIGRLTRDPETRNVSSGTAVVSFGIATNRTYMNRATNEKVEETAFVDVEAWGRTGETIARYMQKGRQIFIEGRLKFDTWERDGQRRSKLSVVCENFQFIDSQGGEGGGGGGAGGYGRRESSGGDGAHEGRAPVGARETPQDDYGDDDIPF
ncbi:MAG: single-stranded DNA-binding protein [Planctomycetota bacterium]|nr:single-stranded DNA-binding protein [Planctomycetota bacterium]